MANAELSKILRITKCKTPCNYNEYKLAYNPPRPLAGFGNETVFGLVAISENTKFQEEVLLYPPSKLENIIQQNQRFGSVQKINRFMKQVFVFFVNWYFCCKK